MEALAWLAIPVVSTLVAIVWLAVANRTRPPASTQETVEAHARFREALRQADNPSREDTPTRADTRGQAQASAMPDEGASGNSRRT